MSETARVWSADGALEGFEATTIVLPKEDDGELVATLVRGACTSRRAVLYVHGFIDYFFQSHVADAFAEHGWDFYALDLRRYGRSLRPGNRPNYCADLREYDGELDRAIDIVRNEEGHETIVLLGHSTGGLIASWHQHRKRSSPHAAEGLILNSPFFDFAVPAPRRYLLPIISAIGAVLPKLFDPNAISSYYGQSLLWEHHGEWSYDQRWKPVRGFPAYFGWVHAIRVVQAAVARGLNIACPVLLQHASQSMTPRGGWSDAYKSSDIVLDVAHMRALGPTLGANVTMLEVATMKSIASSGVAMLTIGRIGPKISSFIICGKWVLVKPITNLVKLFNYSITRRHIDQNCR